MKSLFEQIKELEDVNWNYYSGMPGDNPPGNPFTTSNLAIEFIRGYFRQAGKEWITEELELCRLKVDRANHTVAVFFFGALLLKNTAFAKHEFFPIDVKKWYDLKLFLWFVTCLAHDVAYDREQEEGRFAKATTIDALYDELQVTHKLLDCKIEAIPQDFLSSCAPYFTRRYGQEKTDHGIYAGVRLYDVLVKNRKERKDAYKEESRAWTDDLDPHYALAAATIATHNIWLPEDEKQAEEYRNQGLGALTRRGPIAFKEGQMLYFLGLIDTIDVVKAYKPVPVLEVLKNSFIDYSATSFTITVKEPLDLGVLIKRADQAVKWLAVDVTKTDNSLTFTWKME
jgi:hypothetical protein